MIFIGFFGRFLDGFSSKIGHFWSIFGRFFSMIERPRENRGIFSISRNREFSIFEGESCAAPRFSSDRGPRFRGKIEHFAQFGPRVGWWLDPMVPVTWVGHLKQQMSVTSRPIGSQKVHKVGQLLGPAWLAPWLGRWHLG